MVLSIAPLGDKVSVIAIYVKVHTRGCTGKLNRITRAQNHVDITPAQNNQEISDMALSAGGKWQLKRGKNNWKGLWIRSPIAVKKEDRADPKRRR